MNAIGKAAMRRANRFAVWLYRKSGGRIGGTAKGTRVMLLTVPGRKTGIPRTVPVSYFERDGALLVMGTAGGMKSQPEWIRNLKAADAAEIEIGRERMSIGPRLTHGRERDELWQFILSQAPIAARYEEKSGRTIPVAVLTPITAPA